MAEALVVKSLTFNASWSSAEVNGAEHNHVQISTQHTHTIRLRMQVPFA